MLDKTKSRGFISNLPGIIGALSGAIAIGTSIYSCQLAAEAQRFNAVGVEVQWQTLKDAYDDLDSQIATHEEENDLRRTAPPIESQEQLENYLAKSGLPARVKILHRRRFEKYQSLVNASAQYAPFRSRLPNIQLSLPPPAALPPPALLSIEVIPPPKELPTR